MPKNKDLKRLVRSRMAKTGESYTTALAHVLKTGAAEPTDYAELAGMSDGAAQKATGVNWKEWTERLDRLGAHEMAHPDIAKLVGERWDVSAWWSQSVTVGYERIKGLREIGQRRAGSYETSKSKTLPVPIETLYQAFSDERVREQWLPDAGLTIRTETENRSMRITWHDGTSVEIYFWGKGDSKSQVQLQHTKLESKVRIQEVKAFWSERFDELARLLSA